MCDRETDLRADRLHPELPDVSLSYIQNVIFLGSSKADGSSDDDSLDEDESSSDEVIYSLVIASQHTIGSNKEKKEKHRTTFY